MQPNCADTINTVDVNLTGHWSILKYHEFTKKGFYVLCVRACMHVYFKKLSVLCKPVKLTQNTLKLRDDLNLLHDPLFHCIQSCLFQKIIYFKVPS